ncbi:NADH dehydrogenase [ubiquinone] iron-sulfur protein 6, mitochondrial [Myzus persicae]|uniref:NADH dehydrogenase [ubiquinone] iron-sulfur protein 6, mitochondrial n=1 Tax=Myzus persicae TaxID=13164 RepID=UPI000B9305C1|nr:NADH dehydrogenase [ubiquinone] iron-sulfur protein 6, mitochondrial [Myzus persicae]
MALTMSGLKIAAVGLTQRACRPTLLQAAKYSWEPKDVETHTGQKFEKDDYRLARFVGMEKEVNKSFAIDLIKQVPPKPCTERVVYCDGGGGPLGHPKVYINLDKPGNHACGYCGLRFVKKDSH